jgi:hypothetical protein
MIEKQTISEVFGWFFGLAFISCLLAFWAKWVLEGIFLKDFNYWLVAASLAMLILLTPKKLNGTIGFALMCGTIYIWLF